MERLKDYSCSSPLEDIMLKNWFSSPESKRNTHTILFIYKLIVSGYV